MSSKKKTVKVDTRSHRLKYNVSIGAEQKKKGDVVHLTKEQEEFYKTLNLI